MYEIIEINSGIETLLYATTDKRKAQQQLAGRENTRLKVDGRIYTLYEAECFLTGEQPKPYIQPKKKARVRKSDMPGYVYPGTKAVEKLDAEGNVINTYQSVVAACVDNAVSESTVRRLCKSGEVFHGVLRFRYAE